LISLFVTKVGRSIQLVRSVKWLNMMLTMNQQFKTAIHSRSKLVLLPVLSVGALFLAVCTALSHPVPQQIDRARRHRIGGGFKNGAFV
jgi:hypothetical protein